jgi:hypothetical protein
MEEGEIRIHGAVELDRIDPALGVHQVHGHRRETGGLDRQQYQSCRWW